VIDYAKDNMQQVMQRFQDSGAWNLPVIREVSIMVLFRNRNF
jgi:hypothetical protein